MTTSRKSCTKEKRPHYGEVLNPAGREELAARAQCDTRTVIRWLRGLEIRPSIEGRIDAAAKYLKLQGKKGVAA